MLIFRDVTNKVAEIKELGDVKSCNRLHAPRYVDTNLHEEATSTPSSHNSRDQQPFIFTLISLRRASTSVTSGISTP